ncbi:hypothetical protein CH373_17810 [Leptospira perolatii]|uniref:Cys-rich protein n=1 Tax=Leptospira perolatii TaxID=2023191 RepID=A0A2M9ZII1_9LEPT|nr:hypothetical protein [Leptospira perolatii]PJZ68227.1 hypothetical protein CH360_17385 [Leptospira perolatii]PJZ71774.1 hypothetical protein CH373_17810 [Leptospira perolatii]
MKRLLCIASLALFTSLALPATLSADGCYLCGSGSSDACRDYCRYYGEETWDNRKKCENAGCRVSGTGSCPSASNYHVCDAVGTNSKTKKDVLVSLLRN